MPTLKFIMKKILLTLIVSVCLTVIAFGQATLPVSWGFATTVLPTGWTSSPDPFLYYGSSGNPAPAAKFTATGDKITIAFTTTPGTLTYNLVGNPPPSLTWDGTFRVEESANGSVWSILGTDYTTLPASYTSYSNTLASATRYVRFNFITKNIGNVGLDNVNISVGVVTTQQILVKQGTTTIVNGDSYPLSSPVSTLLPTTFSIKNLGTIGTLNISGVTITGPAAADYSVASYPDTVAPTGSEDMVINFTPSATGSRLAAINIANDDPTATTYVINMFGIGGTLATEPTSQPTNMVFSGVKSYEFDVDFTAASASPDGYLVLRRNGTATTDVPVDGVVYERGDVIGNSKVVYSSSSTSFTPNSIEANTNYYFTVFSYNGPGVYRNYLQANPLAGTVTSLGSMQPANYYSTISTANPSFVTDLHGIVNPHTLQFYSSFGPLVVEKMYERDTTGNQRVVTCSYSGLNKVYSAPFSWTAQDFSREHAYCQSWQVSVNDPGFQSLPEFNDYHNLTPTNQTLVNAVRSNNPLGEVVGTPISFYLGGKIGNDINGKKVYEPRDEDKGDAARRILYESICYTGVPYSGPANTNVVYASGAASWSLPAIISSSIAYGQDQEVLKKWNFQDPPSNFEIARNDYIQELQGNRNPFIDNPDYVCYIDFTTMGISTLTTAYCFVGLDNKLANNSITVSPNPASDNISISYTTKLNEPLNISLLDLNGRVVKYWTNTENTKQPNINITDVSNGIYFLQLKTNSFTQSSKIIIAH